MLSIDLATVDVGPSEQFRTFKKFLYKAVELPSKEIFSWLVTDTNQVVVAKYCVAMLLPIACL